METRLSLIALLVILAILQLPQNIQGHGHMEDPVSRSSAWRFNFPTPINYDDNALYCGGIAVQWQNNGGMCGVCGDSYSDPVPRANENGGLYGTGYIVKSYRSGDKINIVVTLTANHKGHFEFHICPRAAPNDRETEECFAAHPIQLIDGSYKYIIPERTGQMTIRGYLPQGLSCQYCTLRWHYRGANNWGTCPDGSGALGCGPQETFRNCADVSIL